MGNSVLLVMAFFMGVSTSIYLPMNSVIARYVGSVVLANVPFYVCGALATLGLCAATGHTQFVRFQDVPPWLYLSGVCSAVMVLGSTVLVPRLGAGNFFVLFVAGQIVTGLLISHFGLLASPQTPLTGTKLLGLALVIGGAVLTNR